MGPTPILTHPETSPATASDTASLIAGNPREQETDLAEALIARAQAAHHRATTMAEGVQGADADYLLGERNAYAEAAGLALAHGTEALTYAIANRITDDLADGISDTTELTRRAASMPRREAHPEAAPCPQWMGPVAFARRHAGGVDVDFGTAWGPRHEQRISHRHQPGADEGLLYAHDPTWDEYAVLAEHVSLAAVRDAYAHALGVNPHLPVAVFASQITHDPTPPTRPGLEAEL